MILLPPPYTFHFNFWIFSTWFNFSTLKSWIFFLFLSATSLSFSYFPIWKEIAPSSLLILDEQYFFDVYFNPPIQYNDGCSKSKNSLVCMKFHIVGENWSGGVLASSQHPLPIFFYFLHFLKNKLNETLNHELYELGLLTSLMVGLLSSKFLKSSAWDETSSLNFFTDFFF